MCIGVCNSRMNNGLLSKLFRMMDQPIEKAKNEKRWIIYEGDVDSFCVENLNSVMEDNKLLTLNKSERI